VVDVTTTHRFDCLTCSVSAMTDIALGGSQLYLLVGFCFSWFFAFSAFTKRVIWSTAAGQLHKKAILRAASPVKKFIRGLTYMKKVWWWAWYIFAFFSSTHQGVVRLQEWGS